MKEQVNNINEQIAELANENREFRDCGGNQCKCDHEIDYEKIIKNIEPRLLNSSSDLVTNIDVFFIISLVTKKNSISNIIDREQKQECKYFAIRP